MIKRIYTSLLTLLLLTGCTPAVGFGIGGVVGGNNGGTEVIATQDGIHGQVVVGSDIVH